MVQVVVEVQQQLVEIQTHQMVQQVMVEQVQHLQLMQPQQQELEVEEVAQDLEVQLEQVVQVGVQMELLVVLEIMEL